MQNISHKLHKNSLIGYEKRKYGYTTFSKSSEDSVSCDNDPGVVVELLIKD